MPRKRHKLEEIVAKLRQVDVLTSQGHNVADAIRDELWNGVDGSFCGRAHTAAAPLGLSHHWAEKREQDPLDLSSRDALGGTLHARAPEFVHYAAALRNSAGSQ